MRQDVIDFIQTCDKCARRKDSNIPKAPLGEPPVAHEFLSILATGFIGPLPTTKDTFSRLLTTLRGIVLQFLYLNRPLKE